MLDEYKRMKEGTRIHHVLVKFNRAKAGLTRTTLAVLKPEGFNLIPPLED